MISVSELVDKIKAESPKVSIKSEHFGVNEEIFVVEGDIGLRNQQVQSYAASRIQLARAAIAGDPDAQQQGLLGIEENGKSLRWARGKKLSYCVWRPSFQSEAEYQAVVNGMDVATAEWESICGIEFDYQSVLDTKADLQPGQVLFPVIRTLGGGGTIAMAFFPKENVRRRFLWVFDGYFGETPVFDPVGVMRHELGHVLGFRHEHIRPEAPDLFNPESLEHTVEITEYDPRSVMHYVARGVGNPQFAFTKLDRQGARKVYGGPDSEFEFVS